MRTVVVEPPPDLEAWLERRRALGQDGFDEVWEGEYHVAPMAHPAHGRLGHELSVLLDPLASAVGLLGHGPVNLGTPEDYRVPDQAYLRAPATTVFVPTAALVVEILSPGDETWQKLPFYFARLVEELLVVDPLQRAARWLVRGADALEVSAASRLLGLSADELAGRLAWPPT